MEPTSHHEGSMSTYSHGWPEEYWWPNRGAWFLYNDTKGQTRLKHPFWTGAEVLCPHCGQILQLSNYRAECCSKHFHTSMHECSQVEPFGPHSHTGCRGWASLMLYRGNASNGTVKDNPDQIREVLSGQTSDPERSEYYDRSDQIDAPTERKGPKTVHLLSPELVALFREGRDEFGKETRQVVATGRALCRCCGQKITKGEPCIFGFFDYSGEGDIGSKCYIHCVCPATNHEMHD